MQLSPARRRDACLHLIESGFDVDATVDWAPDTFADDPAVGAAKDREKLARNVVTVGGYGHQSARCNMIAFQQALTQVSSLSTCRNEKSVANSEIRSLSEQVERERYSVQLRRRGNSTNSSRKVDEPERGSGAVRAHSLPVAGVGHRACLRRIKQTPIHFANRGGQVSLAAPFLF